jgi:hypothetical protein
MAIKEQDKVFYEELANGDKVINLPITRANNVEGLGRSANTAYVVGDVVYVDNNKKVALKCTQAGTTSSSELNVSTASIGNVITDGTIKWQVCNRTSDVTSVNGKTGDVVVDVPVQSVNGKTGDVTIAETPYSGSATSIGGASATKPAVVVESQYNSTSWYRKYSDGWIEQGGIISPMQTGNNNNQTNYSTVTLPKAFADTKYIVSIMVNSLTETNAMDTTVTLNEKNTTNFRTRNFDAGNALQVSASWFACGKGA